MNNDFIFVDPNFSTDRVRLYPTSAAQATGIFFSFCIQITT